ncbi:MAG: FAD:protein FMN transferase [Methylococcales bacterium]|nr:FAD:protein FMN transferase [Methylococcales bacterium]
MNNFFEFHFKAMGSPCQLQLYASSLTKAKQIEQLAIKRIELLEQRYSRYRETSLLSRINQRAGTKTTTPIDTETHALLRYAEQCYQESEGLFDVSSGVLRHIWDFKTRTLPTKKQCKKMTRLINWPSIEWDEKTIYLPKVGMELDFGGLVKEYAADTVATLCRQQGITAGLVELGGDIAVIGVNTEMSEGWSIAIQHPRKSKSTLGKLSLNHGGLASSGDYQRYIEIQGQRYSHVLNPKTAFPVQGLQAVSVIADHCLVAGSIATIAMLKGKSGLGWLQESGISFMCCDHKGWLHSHSFFNHSP